MALSEKFVREEKSLAIGFPMAGEGADWWNSVKNRFRTSNQSCSERVGADDLTAGPGRESLVDRQISGVGVSAVRLVAQGEGVRDTHNRGESRKRCVRARHPRTDGVLDEPDRPVRERVVGPAGVIAR